MTIASVRVQFEIGHEASVRTKKTPEGFTHDWEVFVRGADNTDIQCFVEKVVFHLHETFPKPRRVVKEPPYVVRESGYAGFVLPIDVYLKNKEEPKKINFQYDLQLQNSGPPISRVLREPRVFQNPSEDFRRKLIRGGGVGVDTPGEVQAEELKHPPAAASNKSKVTESPIKKFKPELPLSNSFTDLFGPPLRKITPEPKKVVDLAKKLPEPDLLKDKKKLNKHSPHKNEKEKDRYPEKDKNKERDKNKEKPPKRPTSPPPPTVVKPKEEHKKHEEKEKKKEDYDDKKKRKEEKDRKDKYKDIKEIDKQSDKDHKKDRKEDDYSKKLNSNKSHDINSEKHNNDGLDKEKERPEKEKHKHRHKKKEKEKNRDKEKHKKDRDKIEKDSREKDREKEKSSKRKVEELKEREEKVKKKSRSPSPPPEKLKKGPLNALLDELGSSDSASPLSEDEEDSIPSFKSLPKPHAKIVPENKTPVVNSNPKIKSTNLSALSESKIDKEIIKNQKIDDISSSKTKKSPGKKNKKSDRDSEKRRIKDEHKGRSASSEREKEDEDLEKQKEREERERLEKEQVEKERAERLEAEKPKAVKKEKESNRKRKRDKGDDVSSKVKKEAGLENSVSASQSACPASPEVAEEPRRHERFTKEYVAQLRDLQHRIMTLEDNAELQKVVQVIAETGQYEITKKTFDFDLCALDGDTVRRLQEFFSST